MNRRPPRLALFGTQCPPSTTPESIINTGDAEFDRRFIVRQDAGLATTLLNGTMRARIIALIDGSITYADLFIDILKRAEALKRADAFLSGAEKVREEGRLEALCSMLTKQLRQRFGELSNDIIERIDKADVDTIERWSERVITGETPDEICRDSGCEDSASGEWAADAEEIWDVVYDAKLVNKPLKGLPN